MTRPNMTGQREYFCNENKSNKNAAKTDNPVKIEKTTIDPFLPIGEFIAYPTSGAVAIWISDGIRLFK